MTLPSWISTDLAIATYTAYLATPNPTTIVLTTSAVTFCQADGLTFTCSPNDLLPNLVPTLPDLPTPQSSVSEPPSLVPETPVQLEPVNQTPSVSPPILDLSEILADLQDSPDAIVPSLYLTATTPATQVVQLLQRLSRQGRRQQVNRHLMLHLAYELGVLQHEYPVQFRNQLEISVSADRTRSRIKTAAERVYKLGQLVGLPRLYGTSRLTLEHLKRMSRSDFNVILIPALQASQWPVTDFADYSEDLVFSDRPHVTPDSDSAHDSEA